MANVDNPHGLKPVMRTAGGGFTQARQYSKPATYAFGCFKWDPVTLLATGYIGVPADTGPVITPGTTRLLGVALNWRPASELSYHQIMDDPTQIFEAQCDGSGAGFIDPTDRGLLANLVYTTAGGGVTRDNSGAQIAASTKAATATLDVKLKQLLEVPDNANGLYARVEIQINKHLNNPEVLGI